MRTLNTLAIICVMTFTMNLANADVYVNGQGVRSVNPDHDDMMYRAAECGAYHVHIDGKVNKVKMAEIRKVLKDYGVTRKEYNAAVVSNIEYLEKLVTGQIKLPGYTPPSIDDVLSRWKYKCKSIQLYKQLSE